MIYVRHGAPSLRTFCHAYGDQRILLLHGYDLGSAEADVARLVCVGNAPADDNAVQLAGLLQYDL